MSFDTGRLSPVSAASAVCSAVDWISRASAGNGVALLDEDDVAGHELGRRDALSLAVADDVGVRRRHLAQRRHRLLRARLLDVAHERVEQHDGEDRDRLVGQRGVALVEPQPGGDRAPRRAAGSTRTSVNWARNFRQAGTGASAASSFLP